MSGNFFIRITLLLFFSITPIARGNSSWLIEPFGGYGRMNSKTPVGPIYVGTSSPVNTGQSTFFNIDGYILGMRLGYVTHRGFILGGEFLRTAMSGKGQGIGFFPRETERKLSLNQLGIVVGYRFSKAPLRIWGSYLAYNNASDTGEYNTGGGGSSSFGYTFGAGIYLSRSLSLNLQYSFTSLNPILAASDSTSFYGFTGKEELRTVWVSLGFDLGSLKK